MGYQTDPADTYCNKFSAYWDAGVDDCGNGNLDEEWCADFAAWVWKQAGAEVTYELAPGYLNGDSASFYVWGTDHGTWHPVGSHYTPQPGDVAVYGLDTAAVTAVHVAVVTGDTGDDAAPDVVNGDGDRTGLQRRGGRRPSGLCRREGEGRPAVGLCVALGAPAAVHLVLIRPAASGLRRVAGRQGDRLHLQEALEPLGAELPADARLLEAAERRGEVDRHRRVQHVGAGPHLAGDAQARGRCPPSRPSRTGRSWSRWRSRPRCRHRRRG